jgi:hypothetical protein
MQGLMTERDRRLADTRGRAGDLRRAIYALDSDGVADLLRTSPCVGGDAGDRFACVRCTGGDGWPSGHAWFRSAHEWACFDCGHVGTLFELQDAILYDARLLARLIERTS